MFDVMLPAGLCVLSRACLNVCDRIVFKDITGSSVFINISLNSIFPFLFSLTLTLFFGDGYNFEKYIFHSGVILSAVGAQLLGCVLPFSFTKLPVKNAIISSKIADLFIPLLITSITSEFIVSDYIFSFFSVLIFLPVLFPFEKIASIFQLKIILAIMLIILFQAAINSYFCLNQCAKDLTQFFSLMTSILFWRAILILAVFFVNNLFNAGKDRVNNVLNIRYFTLIIRAFMSFACSATFFYAITRPHGSLAWPILNATPLVSCIAAHFVLQEKMRKVDMGCLFLFTAVTLYYVFAHDNFT